MFQDGKKKRKDIGVYENVLRYLITHPLSPQMRSSAYSTTWHTAISIHLEYKLPIPRSNNNEYQNYCIREQNKNSRKT